LPFLCLALAILRENGSECRHLSLNNQNFSGS